MTSYRTEKHKQRPFNDKHSESSRNRKEEFGRKSQSILQLRTNTHAQINDVLQKSVLYSHMHNNKMYVCVYELCFYMKYLHIYS